MVGQVVLSGYFESEFFCRSVANHHTPVPVSLLPALSIPLLMVESQRKLQQIFPPRTLIPLPRPGNAASPMPRLRALLQAGVIDDPEAVDLLAKGQGRVWQAA